MFFYQLPCFLICASKTLNYYQKSQMDYLLILLTIIFCLNSNSKSHSQTQSSTLHFYFILPVSNIGLGWSSFQNPTSPGFYFTHWSPMFQNTGFFSFIWIFVFWVPCCFSPLTLAFSIGLTAITLISKFVNLNTVYTLKTQNVHN